MTLAETLAAHGHSLSTLHTEAEALILFGSRTTDLARPDSDWDLLVIGHGQTTLARGLDLVFIPPAEFDSPPWRTSELAGHVARFGQTL
ncbi:MAG: nucleotidyltransferase domain-containing protein, partial [Deltaproteobacteria bacterium]|nr:nucleotidyltransferase domain-containing protein [Deltaproteobacteria bacterium]